jgi:hypothetical protein
MDAFSGSSILALLNMSDTLAPRARTSISVVADAGVGVSSGTNRKEAVTARSIHSEVIQKKRGGRPKY